MWDERDESGGYVLPPASAAFGVIKSDVELDRKEIRIRTDDLLRYVSLFKLNVVTMLFQQLDI